MPREDTQFTKGQPRHPNAGRKKGTLNKSSAAINDTLRTYILHQMPSTFEMFEDIKRDDGSLKAFNALTRLIALHQRNAPPLACDDDNDNDPTDAHVDHMDPPLPALYIPAAERQSLMRAIRQTDKAQNFYNNIDLSKYDAIDDPFDTNKAQDINDVGDKPL